MNGAIFGQPDIDHAEKGRLHGRIPARYARLHEAVQAKVLPMW